MELIIAPAIVARATYPLPPTLNNLIATIWLPGRAMGKARPRLGKYGIFMPKNYVQWKSGAILQTIRSRAPQPEKACAIECLFVNFASSDSDNLTGSVLDALVDANYLRGDSSSCVVSSQGRFVKTKKKRNQPKPIGVLVKVYDAEIEEIDFEVFSDFD